MLPRLIQIGPFPLYSFGLMVVLGFLAGLSLAVHLARRRGLPGELLYDAAVIILLAGIVGARALFVLLNWSDFAREPGQIFSTWQGGMSFHGGAIASILAGFVYVRRKGAPGLPLADAAAPGIALGYAIGRLGCFLNGCCFGGPTDLPWGVPGVYCQGAPDPSAHYHPTQIYALLINLALTAGLTWAYLRPHRVGQNLALFIGGYSIYRFGIEALRKNVTAEVAAFGLTTSQLFSILAVGAAAVWWVWLGRTSQPALEVDGEGHPASAPAALPGHNQ
jgi:phosphatidylglycerol---prolipoprotein diacylglyceryl transferase